MAATNYTPIQLYRTTTASAVPSAANLADGELAINLTDEKLFVKNAGGTVKVIASGNTITGLKEIKTAVSASNIDLSTGNYFTKTISGTTTFTVSNVPNSGTAASFILDLTNGGSATVNWWSGVKWPAGVAPTLTSSGRDTLGFFTYDGGTTWSGFVIGLDVK